MGSSGSGVQKRHEIIFTQSPCRKLPPKKIDRSFDVSFYRVSGCFSAVGVQSTTKGVLQKKSSRKSFTKKSTKIQKRFFLGFGL
jgi:hypothetical protein